jgi:hypothetical protein
MPLESLESSHSRDLYGFETYRNYLQRFCQHSKSSHPKWADFAAACKQATASLRPLADVDEAQIKRWLGIAWNTEALLHLAKDGEEIDLLRIQNAWLPVQAYYAIYGGAEALSYAVDGQAAGSHGKALRKATAFFIKSSLTPWKLSYHGPLGKDKAQHKQRNFTPGTIPAHNLAGSSASDEAVIARCLKAEHQNRVVEACRKKTKPRRYQHSYDPGDTGVLHFLYRLRLRSNYRGINLFVVNAGDELVRSFTDGLVCVVTRTLSYMEAVLISKCGKDVVLSIAREFLPRNQFAGHLKRRVQHYETLY